MTQRICKKCLLKETSEADYFDNLYSYIERLDPDIKVDAAEYERRLQLCKQCDHLTSGMCTICGCFVELRAVISKNYCPNIEKAW